MAGEVKNYLYSWCGKQKKGQPVYEAIPNGPQRFNYKLTIQGIDFVAQGGATNKKEAEAAAAREFLNYLVDNGHLAANSVPPNLLSGQRFSVGVNPQPLPNSVPTPMSATSQSPAAAPSAVENQIQRPAPPANFQQPAMSSYGNEQRDYHYNMYDRKRRLEDLDAESVDTNSHLHGNWTLSNAKARLHQFLQSRRLSADFKYFSEGPDHARFFTAELQVFVKEFRRTLTARESGSNKKMAAQSCSLSLVRQLFHMGAIEAATPGQVQPKRQKTDEIPPYNVQLNPEIAFQLDKVVAELGIQPIPKQFLLKSTTSAVFDEFKLLYLFIYPEHGHICHL
eukprot:gene10876-19699_t